MVLKFINRYNHWSFHFYWSSI